MWCCYNIISEIIIKLKVCTEFINKFNNLQICAFIWHEDTCSNVNKVIKHCILRRNVITVIYNRSFIDHRKITF